MDSRPRFSRRSFRLRLAAAFAVVGIAAAATSALLVNFAFGSRFSGYLEEQRRLREERVVAGLVDSHLRMGGWDAEDLSAMASLALMDGGTLRVEAPDGRTVWESTSHAGGPMAEMHRAMMGTGALGPERRIPIEVGGTSVGVAVVRLPEAGLLPEDASFRSSVNGLLVLGGLAAGAMALLLGVVLAGRATAPARRLTEAARAFASGDRSRRLALEGADEFGQMARAFNAMADTVDEEDRLRRAFAADVAHELRTPLAILRSQVEGLQDRVVKPTPAALASLHEETLRLGRIVADLEALASADAAGFSLELRPQGLRPIVEDAARAFGGQAEDHGISLSVELDEVTAPVDETRLRQVLANLLSNSLKFTPVAGEVRVRLRAELDRAVIEIQDSGPGIPADEIPHVFERFFRGRGAQGSGSGIGLTVVRELVEAQGGTVEVRSEAGRGATFTIRLPGFTPLALPVHGSFTRSA